MFKVCHHKCTTSDVIKKVNNLLAGRKDHAGFQEKFQPFAQADRGPGVSYDVQSERIHERLAHAHQKVLGEDNYRGEIDPRELPLVIAGLNAGPPLLVDGAQSLRILDIAVRGRRPFPGLLISAYSRMGRPMQSFGRNWDVILSPFLSLLPRERPAPRLLAKR